MWLCESHETQKRHYQTLKGDTLEHLSRMDLVEGGRALEVASRWARRNLKNMQEGILRVATLEVRRLWAGEGSGQMLPLVPPQPDINQELPEQGEQVDEEQLGEVEQEQGQQEQTDLLPEVTKALEQGEERDIWITMDEVAGGGTVKVGRREWQEDEEEVQRKKRKRMEEDPRERTEYGEGKETQVKQQD